MIASASAGVWVQPPGAVFVELTAVASRATHLFDESGARLPQSDPAFLGPATGGVFESGRWTGTELAATTEVGVLPGFELFGRLPWRTTRNRWDFALAGNDDVIQPHAGPGDAVLGARIGRTWGAIAGSASASGRFPLYDNSPGVLGRAPGDQDFLDDRPPLGPGTLDLDVGIGVGVASARTWASVEPGVRIRDRGHAPVLPGRVQAGAWLATPLAVAADATWLAAPFRGTADDRWLDPLGRGPIVVDRAAFLAVGASASLAPWRHDADAAARTLALTLRAATTLAGSRSADVDSASFAVAWRPEPR